ncbi:MAG: polysaccharide biosynthesis C-terminal domain-containing protein [Flavobacteriales bacterium]
MIKLLKEFKNRGGVWFFSSSVFERATRLLLSFFVFSELSKGDSAIWTSALILVSSFMPVKSLGIESGILQYTSGLDRKIQSSVFKYFLTKGFLVAFLFSTICMIVAYNKSIEFSDSKNLVYILAFWLPLSFLFEFLLSFTRIIKDHKLFAKIQVTYNLIFAGLIILGYLIFGLMGFALAFALAPLLVFIFFFPKFVKAKNPTWEALNFTPKDVVFYGLKTSVTNFASELLFITDFYLIEYVLDNKIGLADYRVSTIIPLNLGFFAVIFINNDFVHLVEHKTNRSYLKQYVLKYYKLFVPICLALVGGLYLSSDLIWSDLFKHGAYSNSTAYFNVLLFASVSIILLRVPAGNILAAVGLVHINTILSYSTLLFNFVISYVLLNHFGLIGIAYGTVLSLTLSGLVSLLFLYKFLNKNVK